ncbi:uncharacterized protein LOC144476387 [Augochlora pura]
MFWSCNDVFCELTRSYPFLKHIDIFDPHSFIRSYVLDKLNFVVISAIIWFALLVARKIEHSNEQKLKFLKENEARYQLVAALKDKKAEYEDTVIKVKETQHQTALDITDEQLKVITTKVDMLRKEIAKIDQEVDKVALLLKIACPAGDVVDREGSKLSPARKGGSTVSLQDLKVLEPSFPPPQPPPRKYGIFVSRPPGQRCPPATNAFAAARTKIGLK